MTFVEVGALASIIAGAGVLTLIGLAFLVHSKQVGALEAQIRLLEAQVAHQAELSAPALAREVAAMAHGMEVMAERQREQAARADEATPTDHTGLDPTLVGWGMATALVYSGLVARVRRIASDIGEARRKDDSEKEAKLKGELIDLRKSTTNEMAIMRESAKAYTEADPDLKAVGSIVNLRAPFVWDDCAREGFVQYAQTGSLGNTEQW